jgi:hypothetical protein
MGYHPETMAFSFPPYPRGGMSLCNHPQPWSFGRWLYKLSPWIGFDIWHIDPEKARDGQRTDDSCGWFDRTPGPYAAAVKEFLSDTSYMHDANLTLARRKHAPMPHFEGISEPRTDHDRAPGYPRLSQADTLALVLMIATIMEARRYYDRRNSLPWFARPFLRRLSVMEMATELALNPIDNLSSVETPEAMVRLVAAAMHRRIRPWWKHPRWHVHHWQIQVHLFRNLRRTFQRCPACKKGLGFNASVHNYGDGHLYHGTCSPRGPNTVGCAAA